jgi:ribosomal protein S17E
VEEDYKVMKCRMELENYSGKSALSVYQDFHAKVFAKNLVWIMAFSVQNRLDQDTDFKKYRYQINFTQAFSKSKGVIALLFQDTSRRIRRLIADLQYIFQRTVEPIRPGRKYPRKHKAKPRKYFPQYKPIG